MSTIDKTGTLTQEHQPFDAAAPLPGLLVACAPSQSVAVDRCLVKPPFTVGRGSGCALTVREEKLSKSHFCISRNPDGFVIEDLGSTNGTFLNGLRVARKQLLRDAEVIRAGQSVFVFHRDARPLLESQPAQRYGFVGRFHTGPMVLALKEATLSGRHLLFAGPSGSGKELSARAAAALRGEPGPSSKLVAHNAARFSSEEEAAASLFGVGERVFSNVDERVGLIESAEGGVLFLDEIHNLPIRVQRSLLRVIEDGEFSRIGESRPAPCKAHFVFASNAPGPDYGLAPDLLARLRVVSVPPIGERVADIPSIFDHFLGKALARHRVNPQEVTNLLKGDHYESLCLDRFETDNVRGLIDLTDRLATRIAAGSDPNRAISSVFTHRFAGGPVAARFRDSNGKKPSRQPDAREKKGEGSSHYLAHKEMIIAAYRECDGNLSATERLLRARGVRCSRRWLGVFLDKWGIRSGNYG